MHSGELHVCVVLNAGGLAGGYTACTQLLCVGSESVCELYIMLWLYRTAQLTWKLWGVFFENQTLLMTQWFVTANDWFSLHPGGCGLKSTSLWSCWGLWFMLMAEQFKVNRSNLESDLPLRGGTLSRVLVKPRFLEHGFWRMQRWVSCFYLYCDFVLRLEVWVLGGIDLLFAFLVYQVEGTVEDET